MEQLNSVSSEERAIPWGCAVKCSGPCYIACAAGIATGPTALAIVTTSFYYTLMS